MRRLFAAIFAAALVLTACGRPVPTAPPDPAEHTQREQPPTTLPPAPPQETDAEKGYREALDLIAAGNYHEAEEKLAAVVLLDPRFAEAWNDLSFVRVKEFDSLFSPHPALPGQGRKNHPAVEAARKALELRPTLAFAQYNLGIALLANGEYADAIAPLTETARVQSDRPEPQTALGLALMGVERFDEAAAACRQALQLNPEYQLASDCLDLLADGGARLPAEEAAIGFNKWDPAARAFRWTGEPDQAPASEFSRTSPPWTCAFQDADGFRSGFVDCNGDPWTHFWGANMAEAGTTPAGVGVGTPAAEVIRIYGEPRRSGDTLLYLAGDLLMGFQLDNQDQVFHLYFRTRTPYFLIDKLINN